ncbi:SMP-30/gluconolactonase/LRE family protein [Aestuariivirga sp.]|uniref:SMP-30/gluconolactonase/LRE family protein n=1 Tax=Aestuariivirga sp. TaxID=2650926 RepID=UPI0025C00038|nr:SMP-30/gluconolactonase/LRE family protein [Aestuariivirga sp.]MCA3555602.1 SMP-30/gluconolactonase/LRE family protein [Aestuariivirga sp.]
MSAHHACLAPDSQRFLDFFPKGAALTKLATGFIWAEGPVWFSELNELRFSDIPNNRMMRWSPVSGLSVFRQPSQRTNGHTRDREGNMISCEHGGRCVSRTYLDGRYEVLVTHWNGMRFNSPNDVVVKSDGSIWFTDPPYGIISDHEGIQAESAIGKNQVYRFDPASGGLSVVADDFDRPNGLAFSPDESELYIADSGFARGHGFGFEDGRPRHVRGLKVVDGKRLQDSRVIAVINEKVPDGLRVDAEGLLWISAGDGIHCYTKDGDRLGRILVPETVANLTFGGFGKSRLFITATSSLYAIETARVGAQTP